MRRVSSCKIIVAVSGCIALLCATLLFPSFSSARSRDLSDQEMASIHAQGFSTFTLDGDTARINFNNLTINTWTEISSLKMGYYSKTTTGWDNDWTNVSLGSSSSNLTAKGLYIEAKFSNINDASSRQLEYIYIGTTSLTGTISGTFNSFSGTLDNDTTTYSRTNLGTASITSNGAGFYLALVRSGSKMGYTFNWVNATKTP